MEKNKPVNNPINMEINSKNVRVINEETKSSRLLTKIDALREARFNNLDLIEIDKQKDVSICIIADFSKYKYLNSKKAKAQAKLNKKNQVVLKEIQLRPVTDKNDISIKAQRAQSFLNDGNKVKVTIKFRGREMSHLEMGSQVLQEFLSNISGYKLESEPSVNGRDMFAILTKEKEIKTN